MSRFSGLWYTLYRLTLFSSSWRDDHAVRSNDTKDALTYGSPYGNFSRPIRSSSCKCSTMHLANISGCVASM